MRYRLANLALACALFLMVTLPMPHLVFAETPAGGHRKSGEPYVEVLRATELSAAEGSFSPIRRFHSVKIEMTYIPAGTFIMGSPAAEPGHQPSEQPMHEVSVAGFWMSRTEITNEVFNVFDPNSPYSDYDATRRNAINLPDSARMAAEKISANIHLIDHAEFRVADLALKDNAFRPVRGVTQYTAHEFCRWLSMRSGRSYRLPTSAEWEYAARAGSRTSWFFGDDPARLADYAWYGQKDSDAPQPVGRKKPNAWGLYDMYGNLAEWTLDGWSDDYTSLATKDVQKAQFVPRTNKTTKGGLLRGGSYLSTRQGTRSAARQPYEETTLDGEWPPAFDFSKAGLTIGFRIISPENKDPDDLARYAQDPLSESVYPSHKNK
jgi:formylglycine-generating enzyme required for sulfatase activity